ncbi:MAG TPA: ATP-binding cassette domain-containing protein, partial [Alphaproteobacteria bacterium]|nr:ATP-binding cassette domain-containing protein [Alphaproteobacteria bacterium]
MLLTVKDLSLFFRESQKPTLSNLSFELGKGQTLGLVGESGSGKSMTAYSIMGLLNGNECSYPKGDITFKGQPLMSQGVLASQKTFETIRGKDIALIFQEPMTALNPLHTLEAQISETLVLHKGLTLKQARAQVLDLLNLVGFEDGKDRLQSYPHQLSGGQRQRVMIASSIACEPSLLIADEPTTALDVLLQAQILTLIKNLQKRLNMALLFISHDLNVVEKMCDDVLVLRHGTLVEKEKTKTLFSSPKQEYTKKLLRPMPHFKRSEDSKKELLLEVKDLSISLEKEKKLFKKAVQTPLVHPITFNLYKQETLGLVGESGSGKTTLSLALLQLLSSPLTCKGEAFWHEKEPLNILSLKKEELRRFRKNIQIVFQDPYGSLNPRLTVFQLLQEGLLVHFPSLSLSEQTDRID